MSKKRKFLVKNLSLTAMTDWLNKVYQEKETGKQFTHSDTQGYIRRRKLPDYLGGLIVERNEEIKYANLYNVLTEKNEEITKTVKGSWQKQDKSM